MTDKKFNTPSNHTTAWVTQTWLSFVISISATAIGVVYLPADVWQKGYLGMGLLFSVGSTISLSKTIRDQAEAKRMLSRIDEAKLERLLAEYDPFKQ
ncbi:MAG: YiaA/YiaB family inner membrane protein [Cyanobacteria bacterium J06627_3]